MLPQDSQLPSIMKQSLLLCDYIVTQQSRKVKRRALESTSNSSTQNTDYETEDNDPDWDEEDSDDEGNVFYQSPLSLECPVMFFGKVLKGKFVFYF